MSTQDDYWADALKRCWFHEDKHADEYGQPRPLETSDLAICGTCLRVWCETCHPTPSARCPFEYEHEDEEDEENTLTDEAERLLSYWGQHGSDPEVVARWAVGDMLKLCRMVTGDLT